MKKEEILTLISKEIDKLEQLDIDGHIWWNRFMTFIESAPDAEKDSENKKQTDDKNT